MNILDPQIVKDYGIGIVLFCAFLYMFYKQSQTMAKEREELKERVLSLEHKVDADGMYIRDELTKLLRENISSYAVVSSHSVQVNASLLEANQSFKELQKTVGRIKKIQLKEED